MRGSKTQTARVGSTPYPINLYSGSNNVLACLGARCTLKTVTQNVIVFVNIARYQQCSYKLQYEYVVDFLAVSIQYMTKIILLHFPNMNSIIGLFSLLLHLSVGYLYSILLMYVAVSAYESQTKYRPCNSYSSSVGEVSINLHKRRQLGRIQSYHNALLLP